MAVETKVFVPGLGPSKQPASVCCQEFARALECGTDSEGYSSLISYFGEGKWIAGCDLPPLACCPWCGAQTQALSVNRTVISEGSDG